MIEDFYLNETDQNIITFNIKNIVSTTITSSNNLLLLTAQDSSFKSESSRKNKTFTFKNNNNGYINTTVLNNEITAGVNDDTSTTPSITSAANITSSDPTINSHLDSNQDRNSINLIAQNVAYVEYKSGTENTSNIQTQLASLKDNSNYVLTNPISEIHKSWDKTQRGLNQTGMITVGVIATAATAGAAIYFAPVAMGAWATAGYAGATAGAASATSTATISATNSAIDGGNLSQVSKTTLKDTTSKESLQNIAISAAAAALATGAIQASGLATQASNAANTANGVNVAANTTSTAVTTSERVISNLSIGLQKASIYSTSNLIATSLIKQQSLSDSINDQGGSKQIFLNTLTQAVAETGAKEIGTAYHGGNISKATQLSLHATLGGGISAISGNDNAAGILSGAVAGVVGEYTADKLYTSGSSANTAITTGQFTGSLASLTTSIVVGASDEQTAANIQTGSFVAGNAAANNATLVVTGTDPNQKKSSSKEDLDAEERASIEKTFDEKIIDFEWTGGNTKEARAEAAQKLDDIFENYQFAPGEKFNLIGFSHGGNVIKEFTQLYNGDKKIDNLVFLGTPHRVDYNQKLDFSDLAAGAGRVSVYGTADGVQNRGYVDGDVYRGAVKTLLYPKDELKTISEFNNEKVNQPFFTIPTKAHENLKTAPVWNQYVAPNLHGE